MPVYNSEATLSMAIESVLNQSHRNLRLIIVDDASTDGSLKIAKSYLEDPRVALYKNTKNMGAYYSRNVGLYAVKNLEWGYFTTHDADDVSYEHRYLRIMSKIKTRYIVAVQDAFRKIDLATTEHLETRVTMAHAVFKKEIFKRIGYFEVARFGADWEHWARMMAAIKRKGLYAHSIQEAQGDSLIHKNNLTVLIPLGSHERKNYVKEGRKIIAKMQERNDFYRGFSINNKITKKVS